MNNNLASRVSAFLNNANAPAEAKEQLSQVLGEMSGLIGNEDYKNFPELVNALVNHPHAGLYEKHLIKDLPIMTEQNTPTSKTLDASFNNALQIYGLNPTKYGYQIYELLRSDDVSEDVKQIIEDVINKECETVDHLFIDSRLMRDAFPMLIDEIREQQGDSSAIEFLQTVKTLLNRHKFPVSDYMNSMMTHIKEIESAAKQEFPEYIAAGENSQNAVSEEKPASIPVEAVVEEKPNLAKLLEYKDKDYQPSRMAARLDWLINGDRITEDFQRALMIMIDDEMMELHLSCGQPELIGQSFELFINELEKQKGALKAYQMLDTLWHLLFEHDFNDRDYLKHSVKKLSKRNVRTLVLTIVQACRDDEGKIDFLKAFEGLEYGKDDLEKNFDFYQKTFGWNFPKEAIFEPSPIPETAVLDLSELPTTQTGECNNLAKSLSCVLNHPDLPKDVYRAIWSELSNASIPESLTDTPDYLEQILKAYRAQ